MVSLSEFFIKNSLFAVVLIFVFSIFGISSYVNLNRNEDPGFKIRTASIISEAENYGAIKVDNFITKPIEDKLLQMAEIEDIRSESLYGKSVIYADLYEYYDNIQPIWDRLRRKVDLAKSAIPENITPVVNDEFADVFGALIGVAKKGATYEELYDIAKEIKDEFLKLKSRGKVEIIGKQEECLYIRFKNSYLSNLKLTPMLLQNFISSINRLNGAGSIMSQADFIQISADTFNDKNDVKKSLLNLSGNPISLNDVFNIEKTIKKPIKKLVRFNGQNALIVAISLKENGNILKWGGEIKAKTEEIKRKYPNVAVEILCLQSDYVKLLVDKFAQSLFESIIAVILVVLLVLGLKTGVIIGVIILITVLSVFAIMSVFNIGLDKISLSALIISLGILVDNSIVIAQGSLKKPFASDAMKHIISVSKKFQYPLFIVTLTASAAFLPVFLAKSAVGEYASSLPKVIFITLFFSWFYSVSLLPFLLFKFQVKNVSEKEIGLVNFLGDKISFFLLRPKRTIFISCLVFMFSLFAFYFVPKIFFPDSDRNAYEIRLNLKNGVSFEETKKAALEVEKFLAKKKDVVNFSSYIGTSAPRYVLSASPEADRLNFSMFLVNVKNYKTVGKDILDTKQFINEHLPNVQTVVRKIPLGPPYDAPVEIRIINEDIQKLFYYAKLVAAELSNIKGVYLVKNNWGDMVLEYKVKVNEGAAILAGVRPSYLYDYLDTLYNGKKITDYYRGDIKIPIILIGEEEFIKNPDNIKSVSFYSLEKNKIIPINQIAAISSAFTYSKILRRNNSYVLTIQGWIDDTITANKVVEIISPKLDKISGLKYEYGGIIEKSKKGNNSVIAKIPVAFLVIFLILIFYFNSIKKPLLIALAALMALEGANFGLFITGGNFGFMTLLGYICLVGICMNNGVILLNEIKSCEKENIIESVKSRVEPIMLTCLTTIGGMLPLWVKNDPMFSTLAIAVIFGLLSSIFITLFVLPCMYYLTFKTTSADDAT